VLDRICGRYVDCFMTSDGTVVYGGYLTVLMFFREWVEEYQFLQRDFDDIVIYFVARGEPDAREMDEITVNTRKIMGQTCKVTWERVPEIPRTPHGKLLYTRSLVDTHK
jgi:phenylacetate-CoA ligase